MAALIFLSGTAGVTAVAADDGGWPQFRGPQRDGTTRNDIATSWPESGPPVLWRKSIGDGFSEVTVADGRLFVMFADEESEIAMALEDPSGEEIWRTPLGPRFDEVFGDGPRATPVVAGGMLYTLTSEGKMHALEVGNGKVVWSHDLVEEYGSAVPRRGFAGSSLVEGDLLIVEAGGSDGRAFLAFDRKTGEQRWSTGEGPAGYSSGIAATIDGVRQMIFARTRGNEVVSLLPDGKVHWRHEWKESGPIAMPIFIPPNRVFASTARDTGSILLSVDTVDGVAVVDEVWATRFMKNHFSSSVLVDHYLYGFDNATLRCISAKTGEKLWAKRGFGKGTLVSAGGMLLVLSDAGVLALIEATPEAYREQGRFQALTGKAWTAPALANQRLYVRDEDELACLDLSRSGGKASAP
jgi:outer membrane protein assembly factor BamB